MQDGFPTSDYVKLEQSRLALELKQIDQRSIEMNNNFELKRLEADRKKMALDYLLKQGSSMLTPEMLLRLVVDSR